MPETYFDNIETSKSITIPDSEKESTDTNRKRKPAKTPSSTKAQRNKDAVRVQLNSDHTWKLIETKEDEDAAFAAAVADKELLVVEGRILTLRCNWE